MRNELLRVGAPGRVHGIDEARAGIEMKAKPQPGTPSYSQGWAPAIDFADRGQVDQKTRVRRKASQEAWGRYDRPRQGGW